MSLRGFDSEFLNHMEVIYDGVRVKDVAADDHAGLSWHHRGATSVSLLIDFSKRRVTLRALNEAPHTAADMIFPTRPSLPCTPT